MPEPPCCVVTQRVMAVMILIFIIEMQEYAMARSNNHSFALFILLPLAGEGPGMRAIK